MYFRKEILIWTVDEHNFLVSVWHYPNDFNFLVVANGNDLDYFPKCMLYVKLTFVTVFDPAINIFRWYMYVLFIPFTHMSLTIFHLFILGAFVYLLFFLFFFFFSFFYLCVFVCFINCTVASYRFGAMKYRVLTFDLSIPNIQTGIDSAAGPELVHKM